MSGRIIMVLLALAGWFMSAGGVGRATHGAWAEEGLHEGKIRVLLVTGGHGFEHELFLDVFHAVPDVDVAEATYPDAANLLRPSLARKYDVIVFYDMWNGDITPAQQKAFLALLEDGIGVVALHHTLAAHENWPEYARILGGKYYRHDHRVAGKVVPKSEYAHGQDIHVRVAAPDHPITRGLKDFTIHDETYGGCEIDPAVTVLLVTDHPKNNRRLAWVKTYGNSRVCYLQFGHDHDAYSNPDYRRLVARSIRWAAGRPAGPDLPAVNLLDGDNLAGWKQVGKARWTIDNGILVGRQGPGNTAGDLLTKASFDDFEVTVTFRIVWPANSGVWFRYQTPDKAYQADILEWKKPVAWTGTLYCPGKMFLAINKDPKLLDREGWNTLVIRAVANRQMVFLNGTKVADVRDDTSRKGAIGFQVHPGDQFANMRLFVKKAVLRAL